MASRCPSSDSEAFEMLQVSCKLPREYEYNFRNRQKLLWLNRKGLNGVFDVELVLEEGLTLLCSKRDLVMMSPYFERMFDGSFRESYSRKIHVPGVQHRVMEGMIGLFYDCDVSCSVHVTPLSPMFLKFSLMEFRCAVDFVGR